MDFMFDWETEGDRFSFEDSDRFEEDSLCSWISEPESLCNNWRGWRKQNGGQPVQPLYFKKEEGELTSLIELSARAVAYHLPFEVVEHFIPPIPEQLQLRIAFWSFPENEEDIRLYSCLANGSADEFQKGDHLYKARAVKEVLQIGFHLSATVVPPQNLVQHAKGEFNVAVVFDRRRISSCNCTCSSTASWCAHVVALCLYRIHQAASVCLRAPVSESLSRLHREQLQKFAQYLISELPQQILPTAQRLLDELLSSQQTAINTVCGAPDPTAGPSASEVTSWCLDEETLHENIKKTLIKFCVPSPIVFSDVNYLSSTAPPAAAEWQSLLRPLRGREPEGMWNLLSIVREMYRRHDSNAIPLLEILTEEVLACEQILLWWFTTKVSASHSGSGAHGSRGQNNCNSSSSSSSQHAASSLCDEIVSLWRLAALNPALAPIQRDDLSTQLKDWHMLAIDKVRKARTNVVGSGAGGGGNQQNAGGNNAGIKKADIEIFPGFKPALEACQLDWTDYVIFGVTYMEKHPPNWRFTFGRSLDMVGGGGKAGGGKGTGGRVHHMPSQVSGVGMKHPPDMHGHLAAYIKSQEYRLTMENGGRMRGGGGVSLAPEAQAAGGADAAYSSSSEGFCENDTGGGAMPPPSRREVQVAPDSDSDLGAELDPQRGGRGAKHKAASSSPDICMPDVPMAKIVKAVEVKAVDVQQQQQQQLAAVAAAAAGLQVPPGAAAARLPGDASESDEYQMYFYDVGAAAKAAEPGDKNKKKPDEPNYFAGIRKIDSKQDILFARAEALHAHGHTREACQLAKQLAEEMLSNPPDLTTPSPPPAEPQQQQQAAAISKGKKKKASSTHVSATVSLSSSSSFASTTLAKAAFLCSVLLEEPDCHHLAFRVGLFGLEMPRSPAASKALDVKLAYQESELVALLKRIPLGPAELAVIKDRAEKLRDGKLKLRGEALLPLSLASFIFDSLCLPVTQASVSLLPGKSGSSSNIAGSNPGAGSSSQRAPPLSMHSAAVLKPPPDEKLGFEACVAALGLKANVAEAEHPLLCEGTRRQRGDLALSMMVHYKDDQNKLGKIMDKLLDKDVHQMYKVPSFANYLSRQTNASGGGGGAANMGAHSAYPPVTGPPAPPVSVSPHQQHPPQHHDNNGGVFMPDMVAPAPQQIPPVPRYLVPHGGEQGNPGTAAGVVANGAAATAGGMIRGGGRDDESDESLREDTPRSSNSTLVSNQPHQQAASGMWDGGHVEDQSPRLEYLNLEQPNLPVDLRTDMSCGGAGVRPKTFMPRYNSKDTDSSAVEDDVDGTNTADYKAWEAKFRCLSLKKLQKHSVGMASIDSSAPETTSSDNSPTLVRRSWGAGKHHAGPGSDSGSSGSDSIGSSSSADKAGAGAVAAAGVAGAGAMPAAAGAAGAAVVGGAAAGAMVGAANKTLRDSDSPPPRCFGPGLSLYSRSSTPSMKGVRYKGKNRVMPTVPNQPSEASAHFMFELAKNILTKAGGNSSTSLFTQPNTTTNPPGPHRNLHLCAFQVGLYALGLHNCVSPNWLSRTYSSHVSWITGQAMEIGSATINMLIDTWEGHLTPQEVASLADRASRGRDPAMVRAAAELALSCLPHAQALNPNEIQRALIQCKEQSQQMLERACLAVESAAKGGGVYPEVLFDVAKRWYELYEEAVQGSTPPAQLHPAVSVAQQQQQQLVLVLPATMEQQQHLSDELQQQQQQVVVAPAAENNNNSPVLQLVPAQSIAVTAAGAVALPYNLPPHHAAAAAAAAASHIPPHPQYITPYSYVQQLPAHNMHNYSAPPLTLQTHNMHPQYMAAHPYPGHSQAQQQQQQQQQQVFAPHLANQAPLYHNMGHLRPPPPQPQSMQYAPRPQLMQNKFMQAAMHDQHHHQHHHHQQQQHHHHHPQQQQQQQQQQHGGGLMDLGGNAGGSTGMTYLLAAYRVGMLAMETLARRVHDDRPQTKYARNPPYGEDVKWLHGIACKLMSVTAPNYLQQFHASAINAVVSPFVLYELAYESAHFLARSNPTPAQVSQQLRSPTLHNLVQKCIQMFIQCSHQRMHHITAGDYDEFVATVCSARQAFCMTPGGIMQFNDLLQSLRRSKSCKKDLWQRIVSGLASGSM